MRRVLTQGAMQAGTHWKTGAENILLCQGTRARHLEHRAGCLSFLIALCYDHNTFGSGEKKLKLKARVSRTVSAAVSE